MRIAAVILAAIFVISVVRVVSAATGEEYQGTVVKCFGSRPVRCTIKVDEPEPFEHAVEKAGGMSPGDRVTVYGSPTSLETSRLPFSALLGVLLPPIFGGVALVRRRNAKKAQDA